MDVGNGTITEATSSLILMTCDLEFILMGHCARLAQFSSREIYMFVIICK